MMMPCLDGLSTALTPSIPVHGVQLFASKLWRGHRSKTSCTGDWTLFGECWPAIGLAAGYITSTYSRLASVCICVCPKTHRMGTDSYAILGCWILNTADIGVHAASTT